MSVKFPSRCVSAGLWVSLVLVAAPAVAAPSCPTLLRYTMPRLQDEKPVDLCSFAGQVVVVVNTASHCGYTPQYKSLEALNQRFRQRGLVVLGFPSNDFGGQEPAGNHEIADFCENQFAVRFPMFAKSDVVAGPQRSVNPLFAALTQRTGDAPAWNFHKYIIGRDGKVVLSRDSEVDPLDPGFVRDLERLLDAGR
jgi:glutathione peroxidase